MNLRALYPTSEVLGLNFLGNERNSCDKKVLLIDKNGNISEHASPKDILKEIKLSTSRNIYNCLKGNQHSCGGFAAVYAEDFLINNDGRIDYDLDKIRQFAKSKLSHLRPKRNLSGRRLVAYTKSLQPNVFNDLSEVEEALYCDAKMATKCADRKCYTCANHVFFWADDLTDENGKIDFEKGKKLAKERLDSKYVSKTGSENKRSIIGRQIVAYTKNFKIRFLMMYLKRKKFLIAIHKG